VIGPTTSTFTGTPSIEAGNRPAARGAAATFTLTAYSPSTRVMPTAAS
jgi:hypothetical protein